MKSHPQDKIKAVVNEVVELKKNKEYQQAEQLLESALTSYQDHDFLKASLADLYLRQNKLLPAEEIADNMLEKNPVDYRALMIKGDLAIKHRRYKKGLEFYQLAFKQNDKDYLAHKIIKTYLALEEYNKALNLCQTLIEKKGSQPAYLKLKAGILKKMGSEKEAQAIYEQYLKQDIDDEFAYQENIKLKLKDKSPKDQLRELRNILKFAKGERKFYLASLLGQKLQQQKEYAQAITEYKNALSVKSGDSFVIKQLGFCYNHLQQKEEARFYLEEACKIDPLDFYVRAALLKVYESLDRVEEGIEFFTALIKENPSLRNLWGDVHKLSKKVGEREQNEKD